MPERPGGCFAQIGPVPFFPESRKVIWVAVDVVAALTVLPTDLPRTPVA